VTGGPATKGSDQQLAFAARVQPAGAADDASTDFSESLPQDVPATVATALRKVDADTDARSLTGALPEGVSNAAVPVFQSAAQGPAGSGPAGVASPAQAKELAETQIDAPPASAEPLRNISLQIESGDGQAPVKVDLVQRAGELAISVRANGSDMANSLRHDLPELTSRLAERGFQSEMWHPGASGAAPANASAESSNNSNLSQQGQSQSQSNGSQQNPPQQSGSGRDGNQSSPRWFEELQATLHNGGASIGELNGIPS
jgi:hypothetical protein